MFALVRDMPLMAEDRHPSTALDAWTASRWMKHVLLHELYREFGLTSVLIYAAHEVTPALWPWLPADLLQEVEGAALPDVHAFVRAQVGADWMALDATWPQAAGALGVRVNDHFEAGRDMKLACDPDELFHVPDDVPPLEYYESMIEQVVGGQRERRERFFGRLAAWIEERTAS